MDKFIIDTFNYFKREIINEDLFDQERDKDVITQLAISRTVAALDYSREFIENIIGK